MLIVSDHLQVNPHYYSSCRFHQVASPVLLVLTSVVLPSPPKDPHLRPRELADLCPSSVAVRLSRWTNPQQPRDSLATKP